MNFLLHNINAIVHILRLLIHSHSICILLFRIRCSQLSESRLVGQECQDDLVLFHFHDNFQVLICKIEKCQLLEIANVYCRIVLLIQLMKDAFTFRVVMTGVLWMPQFDFLMTVIGHESNITD